MQYLNFQIEVSDDFHMYIAQKPDLNPIIIDEASTGSRYLNAIWFKATVLLCIHLVSCYKTMCPGSVP